MGEYSAYSTLQADSKIKFAAWPTSWRPPGTDQLSLRGSKVNSCIWVCTIDYSAINPAYYYHFLPGENPWWLENYRSKLQSLFGSKPYCGWSSPNEPLCSIVILNIRLINNGWLGGRGGSVIGCLGERGSHDV